MSRGGKVQKYPEEFKQTAIELALVGEKSISAVAKELGVHIKTLHTWVRQHRKKNGETAKPVDAENMEAAEIGSGLNN